VVCSEERDRLAAGLGEAGVGTRAYYTIPLHRQPALERFAPLGPLPGAERAAVTSLALPIGPALSGAEVEEVVAATGNALGPPGARS
jgi:dTDP-4-amino-4,6-dideoxygalactose transaminase